MPHIKAGKLRPMGVTMAKRASALAKLPTVAEAATLPSYYRTRWLARAGA